MGLLLTVLRDSDARRMGILGGVFMNHKVRALVQVEKYGLFGKKKVFEEGNVKDYAQKQFAISSR